MVNVICDSCKKPVVDSIRGETYHTLLNRDLCASCYKELVLALEEMMVPTRPHYSLESYRRELVTNLNRFCK